MNTPGYYNLNNGDVISAAFQANEGAAFCKWYAIKYIVRAGHKEDTIQDLSKAIDVLQRWIDYEKGLREAK